VKQLITLKEIAAELGVSVSTISRVLTDKDKVDPEKRKLIQEALKRHNYVPNEMARGLRGMASRSIGIIVPTLSSNYFTRIITAAQQVAQNNSYTVVTCCSDHDPEREKDAVKLLKTKQISRVMCASLLTDPVAYYGRMFGSNSVAIFDSEAYPTEGIGYISFDNFKAAGKLADYPIALGHRDFVILNHSHEKQRKAGFIATLKEHGIDIAPDRIFEGLRKPETGLEVCRKVFLSSEKRPTAVLATNDFLAYNAIRAAYDAGLRVPEDVSVVCFDACDETGILTPDLTRIMQPAALIGELAADMLIKGKCEHIAIETEFIKGTSCSIPNIN